MRHAHQGTGWGNITQGAIDDRVVLIENDLTRLDRAPSLGNPLVRRGFAHHSPSTRIAGLLTAFRLKIYAATHNFLLISIAPIAHKGTGKAAQISRSRTPGVSFALAVARAVRAARSCVTLNMIGR